MRVLAVAVLMISACGPEPPPETIEGIDPVQTDGDLTPDATLRPDEPDLAPDDGLAPDASLAPADSL
ncbi:MAG: hypothetical protein AAGK21_00735 [Bacteroidota bacterium]